MSTVTISDTPFVGNDRLLVGIVLSVLTFWLFAQSVINVVPAMKSSLDISLETLTLAVSLSALFSGCFVVASGGLADKFGRMRMTTLGLGLSIVGSAMLVVAQGPGLFLAGRVLQGLSAAVPYYGGGMTTPDEMARKEQVPTLAHFAEQDRWIPLDGVEAFRQAHPAVTVHLYPAHHGFNCDQRGAWDAPSAALARERTLAFFSQHLG